MALDLVKHKDNYVLHKLSTSHYAIFCSFTLHPSSYIQVLFSATYANINM